MTARTGRPARILTAMYQGGGNIPMILPVVAALSARGHAVRVMAGPGIRPSRLPVSPAFLRPVIEAGAEVVAFADPPKHPLDEAPPARGLIGGWTPRAFRGAPGEARTAVWAPAWAESLMGELRRNPADIVVADFMLGGALAAAEAAGVPAVALAHTLPIRPMPGIPPYGPGWMLPAAPTHHARDALGRAVLERIHRRDGLAPLNRARSALGLPPLRSPFEQFDRAARVLVLVDAAFDFPAQQLPANLRYVGTPVDDAGAPPWVLPWEAEDDRPLVVVSLSTMPQGQDDLMRRCLAAAATLKDIRFLVTLGPALDSSRFEAPPNTRLKQFVPHGALLPQAAAIVTQCGLGTLTKALTHSVPAVCLPILGDQPANAARVVAHGAGLRLPIDAQPSHIAGAIRRVLTEPRFRTGARQLAAAMANQKPAASRAANEIEAALAQARC